MDPLSIATGILTLLGAGKAIWKGLHRCLALRNAPVILMQLNNVVSDFKVVISSVANICRQHDPATGSTNEALFRALEKSRDVVLELDSFIEYDLTKVGSGASSKVNKSAWMRAERKIQDFKRRFSEVKVDLTVGLNIDDRYIIHRRNNAGYLCKLTSV